MGKREKVTRVASIESSGNMEMKSSDASSKVKKVKNKKKRSAPDLDVASVENYYNNTGTIQDIDGDGDLNELTMGEKLESLRILEESTTNIPSEKESSPDIKVPSADSVHVMLKQALNAEDRDLLLKCLYSRDDKVISNSVSQLSPSDALKLLNTLISMTQLRGAVFVFALPWLRSLLVQHASSIIAQESSLITLNSLYQLIESRTSTFGSALQLSTSIDFLFAGVLGNEDEEESMPPPVIYQDTDSDEESGDGMDTNEDNDGELASEDESPNGSEGSDVMSQ